MRVGYNPHKDQEQEQTKYLHQIVIPVFIPNEEGYYKDAFVILQNCINSLLKTSHNKTFVTIVNNGSCLKITDYLTDLFVKKQIHELIHTNNIGKLNAILKGLSGNNIPLVTISDSDVLFCNHWQSETIAIFNAFPKAGVVGIAPQFKMFESNCANVVFDHLFSEKMHFSEVKDPNALIRFYESIGWNNDYNQDYLKQNLTISNNNKLALVGSGHFVATYRKILFDEIVTYIGYKMGANSEGYLDIAPLKKGFWRLTTTHNYAYHMGNVLEKWMNDEILLLDENLKSENKLITSESIYIESKWSFFLKNRVFSKVFSNKKFKRVFYKYKKLPKSMITNY
ncbi:MAG: glycosyltransferase [Flavobacterium sp.]